MRSPNASTSRLGTKRRAYALTFLLSVLALLLSIATLSNFYSHGYSLFRAQIPFPKRDAAESEIRVIIDTIVSKIQHEVKDLKGRASKELEKEEDPKLRKLERARYTAFLADILGLAGAARAFLASNIDDHAHYQGRDDSSAASGAAAASGHAFSTEEPDEVLEYFLVEEIRKYIRVKPNRLGKQNFMGANGTFTSIGHACFSMKAELEEYMDYDVGEYCRDDWKLAQRLMVHGCDPLPRRRCFSRAPQLYTRPLPTSQSLWSLPDDRNVRWSGYRCKNFTCLARVNATGKGFFKCADCFNLTHHEAPRWMQVAYADPSTNQTSDFLIEQVLAIKPGQIRVGLDFSAGTGTFAARMREFNVTIATATINYGAPFSEMIALRGLLPLYLTINQRLPFFDNTLDIIHTTRFLDGWIDFVFLDFVLYDWDRVLRPGGLLWIDSFFCTEKDLKDYLEAFKMLKYKKHMWAVVPKLDKDAKEVFFSAVLEKPPRPF
ncbi:hypothetical protein Taro_015382 [Colocasia esculenta]|uniref:S-adenosyl-L-methionine-dependent methyltransferase superfamily protein n=1 Tax=Colocasia esculenta TaxID=4460 RepID=A0A843UH86_COLES|nr:hypothetical protein [Colocasia esculenta]